MFINVKNVNQWDHLYKLEIIKIFLLLSKSAGTKLRPMKWVQINNS